MTNPGETFWQDVGEPAANELVGTEMENDGFVGRGVSPEEFDVPFLIVSEETFGVEGAAVDVSGGVAQGGPATPDGLELAVQKEGARQPATAPESKSEGKKKIEPKSKGRSQ